MFEKLDVGWLSEKSRRKIGIWLAISALGIALMEIILFLIGWEVLSKNMIYYLMFPEFMILLSILMIFAKPLKQVILPLSIAVLAGISAMQFLGFEFSYVLYFLQLLYAILYLFIIGRAQKKGETMKLLTIWIWALVTYMLIMGTYVFALLTGDWLLMTIGNMRLEILGLGLWAMIHVAVLFIPLFAIRNAYVGTAEDKVGQ